MAAIPNEEILCIGDGPFTDIKGGQAEGIDTLFITGGIEARRFGPDAARPEKALLEGWLAGEGLTPNFAMPHLA